MSAPKNPRDDDRQERDPSDSEGEDRSAILRRRAVFIASAIAGLSVATTTCDPRPCLEMMPPPDAGAEPEPMPCLSPMPPPSATSEPAPDAGSSGDAGDGGTGDAGDAGPGDGGKGGQKSVWDDVPPQACLKVAPHPCLSPTAPPPVPCLSVRKPPPK